MLGRADDFLICKDGSRISRLGFVFKKVQHINCAQLLQSAVGKVTILVVPNIDFCDADKKLIENETIKRVGVNNMDIEVKLAKLEELRLTKRGKFRLIVNEMPKENNHE